MRQNCEQMSAEPLTDGHGRRSPTCGSRSPTAATSAASTACRPRGCPGSSATRSSASRRSSAWSRLLRLDRDRGRAADRRRAAGAPRVPAPGLDAGAGRGHRRPLADHQRLPARARRRRAGRRGHRPGQRLDRLARPRPLLPDHPPRRAAAGAARARGDRRLPEIAPDQGQRDRDARLHRGRGDPLRRVRPLERASRCASSSSCRSTPTTPGRPTRSSPATSCGR